MLKRYIDYVALIPSKESAAKIWGYLKQHPHVFMTPELHPHSTVRYPGVNPYLELDEELDRRLSKFPSVPLDPKSYRLKVLGEKLVLTYEHPKVVELHNQLNNSNSEIEAYLSKIGMGISSPYQFSEFIPHITLSQSPFGSWEHIPVFKEPITLEGILI